ncbi:MULTISPECIES: VanZ family protein [Priestia]|uniref:VanZ family protein n=1 Tax=Priestia TaxID=2800373 RepID=UPI001C8D71EB|nr:MULTISPECIES: VanZ family protein [Priestia]MBX9985386.1 VanZ family protein [Priestia aryabhattai]MBY0003192.1 VanZ family protein [Priestia aryabhattai]UYV54486.1 VanZ family protein [Priestia megaterium]
MGLITLYVEDMLGYILAALPFYVGFRFIFLKKKRKITSFKKELILGVFVLYLVGLASQTIVPNWNAGIVTDTGEPFFDIYFTNELSHVNIIPFHTLYEYFFQTNTNVDEWNSVSLLNLTANVILFLPLGFFVALIWRKYHSIKKVTILGLSVTCLIEFIQYFIGRSSDIDDVLLNTFGTVIGYVVLLIIQYLISKPVKQKKATM